MSFFSASATRLSKYCNVIIFGVLFISIIKVEIMNGYTLVVSFNGALGECPISQILNTDLNTNTIIASPNEILFTSQGSNNTKIDNTGTLRIYHNQTVTLPTVSSQWISVVDALVYLLQADIMWNTQSVDDSAHFLLIDRSRNYRFNTSFSCNQSGCKYC